jgi:hypothetical protein
MLTSRRLPRRSARPLTFNAALICLGRRRCDVILAMLCTRQPYAPAQRPRPGGLSRARHRPPAGMQPLPTVPHTEHMPRAAWAEPDSGWPPGLWQVPYLSSATPGSNAPSSWLQGSNCQRFAYGLLALFGLACPLMLCLACLMAVRNQRILFAWQARQDDDQRCAAKGQPSRTRKRRALADAAPAAP